jgi:soluble lytic murein transglycosylase
VENNLRLGAAFLKNMLRRYNGHQMLATAAYNAGPSRVRHWLPQSAAIDADAWVETIPFEETRDYVKNVMAYTAVYDHRLGRRPVRLCQRMPSVTPLASGAEAESACSFSQSILEPTG